jgi:branched-chain amino acid transport system substrate-binding protein
MRRRVVVLVVTVGLSGLITGCSEDREPSASAPTTAAGDPICAGDDLLECARRSSLEPLVPEQKASADGEPLRIGMINQENTPLGSFPELSQATQAGIDFVNTELGGVNGRPIELTVCNTKFSPEGSTACAQQFVEDGIPVVLGGIDVFGNGIDTLAGNGVPYVGGIPVSTQSVRSPVSFQWSGGTWGATVAFAEYAATELEADSVAIVYGDFGPIADSAHYGERTLQRLGVENVQLVPYPITATDLTSPLQAAESGEPDAVFLLAADTGCKGGFDAVETVGLDATMFYVGACASPNIVAAAGPAKTDGAIFNVEGPIDPDEPNPDTSLYVAAVREYGDGLDPIGAGTVTFRSFMNLYRVLRGLDPDAITSDAILDALEAQRDVPSFMGHPSTCDHEQLAGLPALCSPQQILGRMEGGQLEQLGTWIDVGRAYGPG